MENRTIEILGHKLALEEFTNEVQRDFMYYSQDSGLTQLEEQQTTIALQLQADSQGITREVTLNPLEQLEIKKLLKVADKKADEYEVLLATEGDWSDEFIEQVTKAGQELKDLQDKIYSLRYQEQKLATKTTDITGKIKELKDINEKIKQKCFNFVATHLDLKNAAQAKPSDYIKAVEWIREGKEYLTHLAKGSEVENRVSRRARGAYN